MFLLKQWTWNSLRHTLPEGFSKFNIDLIYNGSTPHALRALISLTDEDILVIGYVTGAPGTESQDTAGHDRSHLSLSRYKSAGVGEGSEGRL